MKKTGIPSVCAASLLLLAILSPADAGNCSIDYHELAGNKEMPQVREHVCPVAADDPSQNLRVTFVRLDEVLAGNLIKGERIPELEPLFGGAKFIDNDVSAGLKVLFDKFAHKEVVPARNLEFSVTVETPRGGENADLNSVHLPSLNAREDETRRLWSISSAQPTFNQAQQYNIEMPEAAATITETTAWPKSFKQFYICEDEAIQCTTVWHYVSRLNELDKIERDTDKAGESTDEAGQQNDHADEKNADKDQPDWNDNPEISYKTHFALFRHLGKTNWPPRFLVIKSNLGCLASYEFSYIMPPLAFDIAVVENPSSKPIRIADLIGVMQRSDSLKESAAENDPTSPAAPQSMAASTLPPGGAMIIPLQAVFLGGVVGADGWGSMSLAQRMYRRIASKAANATFSVTARGRRGRIVFQLKKAVKSFGPPELPQSAEYWFGARFLLSGFLVGTQDLTLSQNKLNRVTLYAQEPADPTATDQPLSPDVRLQLHQTIDAEGSCPILYSWDAIQGEWVKHGKVIHTAHGEENETTELVNIDPKARRFRLAEEELEIATMRRARLILDLHDGRRVIVSPTAFGDGVSPLKIQPYSKTDFSFSIPDEYISTGIDKAQLAVTGFYTRYSEIVASKFLASTFRKH